MTKESFTPNWYEDKAPQGSYRALLKWGALNEFSHPNRGLVAFLKSTFDMTDEDFKEKKWMGLDLIQENLPSKLTSAQISTLTKIVGTENFSTDTYKRIEVSYGKGMIDIIRLRNKLIENIPDAVVFPKDKKDIQAIIAFCNDEHIPVYVFGGGSSVTRGMEAVKGGITLDMRVHMNKVIEFNEKNQTITVEAGMSGPNLEDYLNHAPENVKANHRYTCGHFPQSFEFSSVGGWVVTKGAGQNSTYYGKIEDIVIAQEYITPRGIVKTQEYPRTATGPNIDQIMMGNEGSFGVLAEVTLKVFRFMPENRKYFSYMFRNWQDAQNAAREIMQSEYGYPSVFRLSDAEETNVGMKQYGIENTIADILLKKMGYRPMEKCLLLGFTDGGKDFCKTLNTHIRKVCKKYGAFNLSAFRVTQAWEKGRFRDPYLREDFQDYGIMIDTLECSVNWAQLSNVHSMVRDYVKSRPQTVCMTHMSHMYPQGSNLYFIFMIKTRDINEYLKLQYGILETIKKSGAAMSHHHGVGKQTAPWLEEQIGKSQMDIIRALKEYFDPNNIMNPGGTLGLDMSPEQKNKTWNMINQI